MNLRTRMVIGWVAVVATGASLWFGASGWLLLGALIFAGVLRHGMHPRFPSDVSRRRTWILLPITLLVLLIYNILEVPESPTHPLRAVEFLTISAVVIWLIRDDLKLYRELHDKGLA